MDAGVSGHKADTIDGLVDSFGRRITYVRLSVTDRCDLRCRYCMAERMQFLPKREILALEEMVALSDILIARGVRKIRLTGGEPLFHAPAREDRADVIAIPISLERCRRGNITFAGTHLMNFIQPDVCVNSGWSPM